MSARCRPRTVGPCRAGVAGLVLLGALGGWLGSCGSSAQGDRPAGPVGPGTTAPAGLPPGAIRVGRDLYQVPIGTDADGCPMYRLYSPTLLVTQAISYRSRDGGFTIDKQAAACDPVPSAGPWPPPRSPIPSGLRTTPDGPTDRSRALRTGEASVPRRRQAWTRGVRLASRPCARK